MFTLQGLRQRKQIPYCDIRSFAFDSKKETVHSILKMVWSVEVPL